jgi:antitoxin VapB
LTALSLTKNMAEYGTLCYLDVVSRMANPCLEWQTTVALSIKTAEADHLARSLARLTGETMTEAVTTALRERLARERARRESLATLSARIAALSESLRSNYHTRQVSRGEWNSAAGDEE